MSILIGKHMIIHWNWEIHLAQAARLLGGSHNGAAPSPRSRAWTTRQMDGFRIFPLVHRKVWLVWLEWIQNDPKWSLNRPFSKVITCNHQIMSSTFPPWITNCWHSTSLEVGVHGQLIHARPGNQRSAFLKVRIISQLLLLVKMKKRWGNLENPCVEYLGNSNWPCDLFLKIH